MVQIAPIDPAHPPRAALACTAYFTELTRRFDTGFDLALSISADMEEMRHPAGLFWSPPSAEPIGSGALSSTAASPPELKRMWVAESARGSESAVGSCKSSRPMPPSTGPGCFISNEQILVEAIAHVRSVGYVEVPAFNDEPYADHWF